MPEHVEIERALVLHQRAAQPESIVQVLLRTTRRHKGTASAQLIVSCHELRVVADGTEARLRDDLDGDAAGAVELRSKLIAGDANRSNLRLGRQRAALEAVDADHGARASHVLELLLKRRGIVGERIDLIARERGAKRRPLPVGGRRLLVLSDGDGCFKLFDVQHRRLTVLAAPHANIRERARLESRKLGSDRVSSRREARDDRDAGVRRLNRRNLRGSCGRLQAGDRDRRADDDAAARVDNGHPERGIPRLCADRRCEGRDGKAQRRQHREPLPASE